jgi:hypothetical protein
MMLLLAGCTVNDPVIVAHRALGVGDDDAENNPGHAVEALEAGFGVELDIRLDGEGCGGDPWRAASEGCFDLGHTQPNGHTLADLVDLLPELRYPDPRSSPPLVLDVVNDPDRAVSLQILEYVAWHVPDSQPVIVESSSEDGLAIVAGERTRVRPDDPVLLGLTYFADPEFTVPDYVDILVVNIAELPSAPLLVPVAVYGVASASTWKMTRYATSDVAWVITDFPTRAEAFEGG